MIEADILAGFIILQMVDVVVEDAVSLAELLIRRHLDDGLVLPQAEHN